MYDHAAPAAPSVGVMTTDPGTVPTSFLVSRLDTGETEFASPEFESITGHPVGAVLGRASIMGQLVHPEHLQAASEYAASFWSGRAAQSETRIVRADGEVRWVRLATSPLPPEGGVQRMVTSMEDITARVLNIEAAQRAEASARAAHEAKSALISRMSHELRTPLNAVIGFGQLLERRITDPDDQSSLQYIVSSGRHLLGLINEVLDISRIGAGTLSLNVEPVEAASLVDEVLRLTEPAADRAAVAVAVEGGPAGLRLLGDRQRLVQVLQSLMANAVRFNRSGGHIWISWSALGGASVTVRDDGPGIPRDRQQTLFTPIDRLGAESVAQQGGGVGLTVSQALVELMGGSLTVESVPGAGSAFTIALPSAPDRRSVADAPSIPAQQGIPPTTLLYIEDNEPNVRVVSSLLRLRPGWQLVHAARGEAGLALARSRRPDLVLLDLHLPDCFGLTVLESLKSDPATVDIPVVVLSADASSAQVDRLLQAGAAEYLTKPLVVHEILRLLDGITADQRTRMIDA